jgi:hypothetical protein
MKPPTPHGSVPKTAIGYVRVSTQEQATEGVSLDAQRDRLRSYCKLNDIRLVDILGDERISGSTLERPGLQAALHMLRRGRANTLRERLGTPVQSASDHAATSADNTRGNDGPWCLGDV